MTEQKKCKICAKTDSPKWIERKNIAGEVAHFCCGKCYQEYKKQAAEVGICEFC